MRVPFEGPWARVVKERSLGLLRYVENLVFSDVCFLCGAPPGRYSQLVGEEIDPLWPEHRSLCAACSPKRTSRVLPSYLARENAHCPSCGEPTSLEEALIERQACWICRVDPPPFSSLRSLWFFEKEIGALIKGYKYRGKTELATSFAHALARAISGESSGDPSSPVPRWDFIVPIPSSPRAERRRSFNHTSLVAHKLARLLGVPVATGLLVARQKPCQQASLPPNERLSNVGGMFDVKPLQNLPSRLLLYDDTVTTGATVIEAARTLRAGGVCELDALTLARSRNFRAHRIAQISRCLASFSP